MASSISPAAEALEQFMVERRKVHRKPQLPTHSLASLHRQSVHTSPVKQLIVRPSPTPISPSYKAAKVPPPLHRHGGSCRHIRLSLQANKSKVIASGTYVPPKTVSSKQVSGKPVKHQVASSGIFVPPSEDSLLYQGGHVGSGGVLSSPALLSQQRNPARGDWKELLVSEPITTRVSTAHTDGNNVLPTGPERPAKAPRPPSPATLGPGELFFKVDGGTK